MPLLLPQSVFFHIPKTGGTWVRLAVRKAGIPCREWILNDGMSGKQAHHATREFYDDIDRFSFAFVRHPLSYYQSYWTFKMRQPPHTFGPFDREYMHVRFERFVINVLDAHPEGWASSRYRQFCGEDGKALSFVGKQEHLVDDCIRALSLAGESFRPGVFRSVVPRNLGAALPEYRDATRYTPMLRDAVLHAERDALELFSYEACACPAYTQTA